MKNLRKKKTEKKVNREDDEEELRIILVPYKFKRILKNELNQKSE